MVTLRPVTLENWLAVIRLTVAQPQRDFVAPNVYSLAECLVTPRSVPLAIYADDEPVGFVMYCFDPQDQDWWVYRLMVAEGHQGKGYGREALRQALERLRQTEGAQRCYISFEPENDTARRLYTSMGFVDDNRIDGGEVIFRREL